MDNAKPCGGAIPVCMVEEFNLPSSIIDRKVNHVYMVFQHFIHLVNERSNFSKS